MVTLASFSRPCQSSLYRSSISICAVGVSLSSLAVFKCILKQFSYSGAARLETDIMVGKILPVACKLRTESFVSNVSCVKVQS